jgi:hypothetical protein
MILDEEAGDMGLQDRKGSDVDVTSSATEPRASMRSEL